MLTNFYNKQRKAIVLLYDNRPKRKKIVFSVNKKCYSMNMKILEWHMKVGQLLSDKPGKI